MAKRSASSAQITRAMVIARDMGAGWMVHSRTKRGGTRSEVATSRAAAVKRARKAGCPAVVTNLRSGKNVLTVRCDKKCYRPSTRKRTTCA